MRKHGRTDANQETIIAALRSSGATVQPLSAVGSGCPDILVGFRGQDHLMEIKNPNVSLRDQRLTKDEAAWHNSWRGHRVWIVCTPEQAISIITKRRL